MKNQFFAGIERFIRDEEGATAVEYGLVAALIAVVVVVAVSHIGHNVCEAFNKVAKALNKNTGTTCTAALTGV